MSTISKFAGRVVCTKAQFDALAEKDPNKEYLVTDDDTYGGGKLYKHNIHMIGGNGEIYFTLYTSQKASYTDVNLIFPILGRTPYQFVYYNGVDGIGIGVVSSILDNNSFNIKLYKDSATAVTSADITLQTPNAIYDTVTEL